MKSFPLLREYGEIYYSQIYLYVSYFIHFYENNNFMKIIPAFSGFHGHYLMLSDFGALCRVVWIFGNIRRFNPHAGVVLREYDDD